MGFYDSNFHNQINTVPSNNIYDGDNFKIVNENGANKEIKLATSSVGNVYTNRWGIRANNTLETGSNIGTDFSIIRYDDSGVSLDSPFFVKRSTGYLGLLGVDSPTYPVSLNGNSSKIIGMERNTTSNTAGNHFTIRAGGATSSATNKSGGNLYLYSGTCTGSGSSNVIVGVVTAGSSGTSDGTPIDRFYFTANGLGIRVASPTARLEIVAGTNVLAPFRFNDGVNLTTPISGVFEYSSGRLQFTDTDLTRRHIVQAVASTKTTSSAPYVNDGYITLVINGTTVKVMTTA